MASESLKALLFMIRQHDAYQEFLAAVAPPAMPRFKKSKGETLEAFGAQSVFASGQMDQHDRWLTVLTGKPERETETSQQEKS